MYRKNENKRLKKVKAHIKKGLQIAEYKAEIHKTKMTGFEVFCREELNMTMPAAQLYERIGKLAKHPDYNVMILPPALWALSELGYMAEKYPEAFSEAIKDGRVHASMSVSDAKKLRKSCETGRG